MSELVNIYCDESCHLEHHAASVMGFGAIVCPKDELARVSGVLFSLREKYNARGETKWGKVSHSRIAYYRELIDYFFNEPALGFRALLVRDKGLLNHAYFNQGDPNAFYYKMYYFMLLPLLQERIYHIYLDKKDTQSRRRVQLLHDALCRRKRDWDHEHVAKVQTIHSHDSALLQLADFLLGATVFAHREDLVVRSPAKTECATSILSKAGVSLHENTPPWETKFNLFTFNPSRLSV
jgi:hypothetical protein